MFVHQLSNLSYNSDYFNQNSFIFPSFAPVTPTIFENLNNQNSNSKKELPSVMSKISNTVIIKNINRKSDSREVLAMITNCGEVAQFLPNIGTKGFAFSTLFDSRSAERVVRALDGKWFNGSQLRCEFVFRSTAEKHDNSALNKCPNVLLTSSSSSSESFPIHQKDVENYMRSAFGEVRQVVKCKDNVFIVEFFDFRNAKNVLSEDEIIIKKTSFKAESVLDIQEKVIHICDTSLSSLYSNYKDDIFSIKQSGQHIF